MPNLNHFLVVYVGDDDPNAGRIESRMYDMMRYDRCHPMTLPDRLHALGFRLMLQPYVKDMRGGFTVARWASHGFRTLFEGKSTTRHLPDELEKMMLDFEQRKTGAV